MADDAGITDPNAVTLPPQPTEKWITARERMLASWRAGRRSHRALREAARCGMNIVGRIVAGIPEWGWIPFAQEAEVFDQAKALVAEAALKGMQAATRQQLAVTVAEAIASWREAKERILRLEGKALALTEELWDRLRAMAGELTLASFIKYRAVPALEPERDAAGQPVIDPATGKPRMRQQQDAHGRPVERKVPYLDGPAYLQALRTLQSLASSITSTSSFTLGGPSARVETSTTMPTDEQLAYMLETGQLPEGLTFQQLGQIFAHIGDGDEVPPGN